MRRIPGFLTLALLGSIILAPAATAEQRYTGKVSAKNKNKTFVLDMGRKKLPVDATKAKVFFDEKPGQFAAIKDGQMVSVNGEVRKGKMVGRQVQIHIKIPKPVPVRVGGGA